jgi:hypothetical protein
MLVRNNNVLYYIIILYYYTVLLYCIIISEEKNSVRIEPDGRTIEVQRLDYSTFSKIHHNMKGFH